VAPTDNLPQAKPHWFKRPVTLPFWLYALLLALMWLPIAALWFATHENSRQVRVYSEMVDDVSRAMAEMQQDCSAIVSLNRQIADESAKAGKLEEKIAQQEKTRAAMKQLEAKIKEMLPEQPPGSGRAPGKARGK
jgi:hypothetical protein